MENKADPAARKWVLIPVETKAREYHAKLLLSCVAAEAGFGVIMGHMNHLQFTAPLLPRGIVFGNNLVSGSEGLFRRYRRMGFAVAAWCEEGIAYRNRASYRHERVSAGAMRQLDVFFAWGDYHAEDVRQAIDTADAVKVVASGSPRLDLLRPEYREFFRPAARHIRSRLGPFVLVNTNFHRFNHFLGRGAYLRDLKARGKVTDAAREAFFQSWIDFLGDMYAAFVHMLKPLCLALPDHTVVVRPHPSEDHEAWRRETKGLPNVKVLHEGSSLPWILAADAVVHNSCATGIEAFVMDVPVVAYRPLVSEIYDAFLPNVVSREVFTEKDLVDLVATLVSNPPNGGGSAAADKRQVARRFFSGLDGRLASERIVQVLETLDAGARPFGSGAARARVRELAVRAWLPTRALIRKAVKGRHPLADYLHQKFPALTLSEVRRDRDRLRTVSGRFARVRISEIGDMLFCVTADT